MPFSHGSFFSLISYVALGFPCCVVFLGFVLPDTCGFFVLFLFRCKAVSFRYIHHLLFLSGERDGQRMGRSALWLFLMWCSSVFGILSFFLFFPTNGLLLTYSTITVSTSSTISTIKITFCWLQKSFLMGLVTEAT